MSMISDTQRAAHVRSRVRDFVLYIAIGLAFVGVLIAVARSSVSHDAFTVLNRIPHLKELLQVDTEDDFSELRRAEATGRPLGAPEFVAGLEKLLGR